MKRNHSESLFYVILALCTVTAVFGFINEVYKNGHRNGMQEAERKYALENQKVEKLIYGMDVYGITEKDPIGKKLKKLSLKYAYGAPTIHVVKDQIKMLQHAEDKDKVVGFYVPIYVTAFEDMVEENKQSKERKASMPDSAFLHLQTTPQKITPHEIMTQKITAQKITTQHNKTQGDTH